MDRRLDTRYATTLPVRIFSGDERTHLRSGVALRVAVWGDTAAGDVGDHGVEPGARVTASSRPAVHQEGSSLGETDPRPGSA